MSTPSSDGILDVDYVGGFYAEMSPVRLNFIAALNGVAGPGLKTDFNYCELGCGLGETTALLAASYPRAQFVGIDLSEAHVEAANRLAAAGGINNIRFLAADIAQLDLTKLPQFDYITMHGLYAWVPETVRCSIDRFIANKLQPGGLLHVSYNAQPGAFNFAILRRSFLDLASRKSGTLLERAIAVTQELESLRASGAPLFVENPAAAKLFEMIRDSDRRYLVHEMFSEGWQPLAFSEVNARMAAAGLEFVGDSEIMENLTEHCTLAPWTERISAVSDRAEQESLKDLIHNRTFRRDVFRCPRSDDDAPSNGPLLSTLVCTMQRTAQVSPRVNVTGGTLDLTGGWFDRLREILDLRILSVEEILNDPVLAGCPRNELLNGLKLAAIDGAIGPAVLREASSAHPVGAALQVAPALNRTLLERFDLQRPHLTLASPVTGRGLTVGGLEAMVLASIGRPSPEHWMLQCMQSAGRSLKATGADVRVESIAEQLNALRQIAAEFFRVRAPKLASLGILVPAEDANEKGPELLRALDGINP